MNNEELKIIIKATTEAAVKEIKKVKKELNDLTNKSKDKGLSESFKEAAKHIAVATTAVTGLVVAMNKLATASTDAQKAIGKLETGFKNAGYSGAQAKKTFKDLYGFLGEVPESVEAGNLLAQLAPDEAALSDWTTVLQGVYATFPDAINIPSLTDSILESANVGKVTGQFADALNWMGVSEDAFNEKLAQTNSLSEREALIRSTLIGLYSNAAALYQQNNADTIAYNESQAQLNITLAEASRYLTPLLTSMANMASMLLQVLAPAIQMVSNVLIVFIQWITAAASAISSFFGGVKEDSTDTANSINTMSSNISKAATGASGLNQGLNDSAKAAEKLKKATMGFDELNVVSNPSSASGNSGTSGGAGASIPAFTMPNFDGVDFGLDTVKADLDEVKERVKGILVLAGLVAGGFAAWKILDIVTNPAINLKNIFKDIGAYALIIGGALLLVQGYSDAWANGIDWGNLAMIMGGIAGVVGGIALKFGSLAGGIALVVGGIAMVVIGVKDLVENGYSAKAVIMVAVGAIAILIGVLWAMNAALLANPITWVVVAIMALVAVFVILWNECDGFRQFWIDLWEKIKVAFKAVVEWFKEAGKSIAQFFVDAWNKIKSAWSAVTTWFGNVWKGIKNTFSAVGSWFSNIFTSAWNGIKKAFSFVSSFFTNIWNTIKSIFSKVGSTIGGAVSKAFSNAINWVLEKAIGIINGFIKAINLAIGIINKIPGVNIKTLSKLDVPKLAKGGIVNSATLAVVGERGKEAVMPLENNTEWMNILADKLSQRMGGNTPIVLEVDGKVFAQTSVKTINDLTRQTGSLQLKLV